MKRVVVGVALAAGAAAVLVAAVPGLPPASARDALAGLSPGVIIGLLVLVGLLLVALSGRRAKRIPDAEPLVPERDAGPRAPAVGAPLDDRLDFVADREIPRDSRIREQRVVREHVREVVVTACRMAADCDLETAERAVETGAWTDDPRAGALVGGPEASSPPLHVRVWDLVRSESAFRRRVRHALDEVRVVQAGDRDPGVKQ